MGKQAFMRKRLFVDPKIQGALIARVVGYWITCLLTVATMLLCWQILLVPRMPQWHVANLWTQYGSAMVASLALLPIVVLDIIRLSNRFVGPFLRLRRAMRALARGERVRPLQFRRGDFWCEFADEFNALAARVQSSNPATKPAPAEPERSPAEVVLL